MMLSIFPRKRLVVYSLKGKLDSGIDIDQIIFTLEKFENSRLIKGVILNVDSSGGEIAIAESLYKSIRRLAFKKPVISYIQNMGTSGAYLMISSSTKIVAPKTAIIGGIGVFMRKISLEGLFKKLGIKISYIKKGKYKDVFFPHRNLFDNEKKIIQEIVDGIYNIFIEYIAESRNLQIEEIEGMEGKFFSGKKAKELKLIDENGDLKDAIRIASEITGVPQRSVVFFFQKESFINRLIKKFVSNILDMI